MNYSIRTWLFTVIVLAGLSCDNDEDPPDSEVDLNRDSTADDLGTMEVGLTDTRDDLEGALDPGGSEDTAVSDLQVTDETDLNVTDETDLNVTDVTDVTPDNVADGPSSEDVSWGDFDVLFPDGPVDMATVTETLSERYSRQSYAELVADTDSSSGGGPCEPATPAPGLEPECATDPDCPGELSCRNERLLGGHESYCACYEEYCHQDSDCGLEFACFPGTSSSSIPCGPGLNRFLPFCSSQCLPAECREDMDCGDGGRCIIAFDACNVPLGLVCADPSTASCLANGCPADRVCILGPTGTFGCVPNGVCD